MAILETMLVVVDGDEMVINSKDFNPDIHDRKGKRKRKKLSATEDLPSLPFEPFDDERKFPVDDDDLP
jgi:hypothetical protein